jgi:polyisoprenoid-binding protein YceI
MLKHSVLFALVVAIAVLAWAIPGRTLSPASPAGSWLVDARHSDAQLTADGTTDFGKTKTTFTIGYARVNGKVKLDNQDPAKSDFDLHIYPAGSMAPSIDEAGKSMNHWMANLANHTLVCFHSKSLHRSPDGRLQASGDLVLTRVDRNIELTPNEAYAGPVYGPPMIHRIVHEATFVFDFPAAGGGSGQKDTGIQGSGTTTVAREDFPQLLKAVIATYWPPVVQDKNCQVPAASEAYGGAQCTGTFLMTPALPEAPHATNEEDYPGPANFNTIGGEHLTIAVHLRLTPNPKQGVAAD